MIWIYEKGNQKDKKESEKILNILHTKQPDAELLEIDEESFNPQFLDEILQSQGLFSPKYIITLNFLPDGYEKKLKESEHAFIAFKEVQKTKTDFKKDFSMADRLGERDVTGLWQLFARQITNETSPEEIHGMFVWQIKGILLAAKTKLASQANMNDYPYTKAKRFAKNFSIEELEEFLFQLITMYDEAHSGKGDLKVELERWVLSLAKK